MKKSPLILGIILILALCIGVWWYIVSYFHIQMSRVIEIRGIDSITGQEVSRGMGYLARDTVIITSAHVVPDDRRIYETTYLGEELPLSVKARLPARDIALLTLKGQDFQGDIQDILSVSEVKIGDTVSIPVSRSGSLVRLTGVVREVAAQVLAYDQHGEVKIFSGIILPDTPFLPGDSGAPVFNRWGKLIDVVHVR